MSKSDLRKTIRLRLKDVSGAVRAGKSAHICEELAAAEAWRTARTVGLFAPLPSEPDVELLWAAVDGRTLCYPRIAGKSLVFLRIPGPSVLLETNGKLREPPHLTEALVPIEKLDLLLVPGVAFTPDGHRLGRGGGYYDRLLADPALRAPAFGVCFEEQLTECLPMEAHDRPVKRVISG